MKKIMLIEDDTFISSLITSEIKKAGYEVEAVYDGSRGITAVVEQKPDLILLDLLMPQMDGFQVLEKLKADVATSPIPVIVFSNFGEPKDVKRAKDGGAVDFLVKVNFTPKEIIEKIRNILGAPTSA